MIGAMWWNMVQQLLRQVSVRVDQSHAMSQGDVLHDHVAQQRRFAGTRLSDDVDVLTLVHGRYAKGSSLAPIVALADGDGSLVVHGAKTSRHSFQKPIPRGVRPTSGLPTSALAGKCRQIGFGASRQGNGGWF
jgi:hypothetical protein